ncbi:MAG: DNA polymerase I [Prochloraceae cyanobacterium]|nr:DNA polymerase I [Prochloraceae cyanobacterium]
MSKSPQSSKSIVSGVNAPETDPLLILIDGHSLAFRSYYAFAKSKREPLHTSTGVPTSVCFGFVNSLLHIIKSQQPQYIAVAFDRQEPSFRHQADPNYKANRKEVEPEFITDLNNLQQLLSAFNLQTIAAAGYEADDVLATIARKASKQGYRVKIVSGDRDLFQLVDDRNKISVIYLDNKAIKSSVNPNYIEFDADAVVEKLGIKPEQIIDYKALCGDKSDNIPGVRGIGEKTAVKLMAEYGSLEVIYQNIDEIKGAVKKKLEAGKEDAIASQYLAKLVEDISLKFQIEDCKLQGFDSKRLKPLLETLELHKFLQRIERLQEQFGGTLESFKEEIAEDTSENKQLSIFDVPVTTEKTEIEAKETYKSPINPRIIQTSEQLTELIDILKTKTNPAKPVAWDTETTSLTPKHAELVGIGCCWGDEVNEIAYIPVSHTEGEQLKKAEILSALRPILESSDCPKVLQNAKFDRLVLWHQGIKLAGVVVDTMLASYVLYPEQTHNLKDLCDRYLPNLGIKAKSYEELNIPKKKTIADLDIETVAEYCGIDAYTTFCLVPKLQAELEKFPQLDKLLLEVEQPLEPVLAEMELQGFRIDTAYLQELSKQLEKDLEKIERQAYEDVGEKFNLASPKELSEILFEKLALDKRKSRKIKSGYSTDRATLEKLQDDHPIIDRLLEYRTLSKLKSTYVDALPNSIDPDTKRVHTNFNQTVTSTGRLSSSNPNLQNIPIRTQFSRQIRKAFIPKDDWLLVSADYSQIELRILAHLSQEPVLIEAYKNSQDVHSVTAKILFDKETVTPEERGLGKIINFGVIYGMGAQRFAREAKVSPEEGRKFIEKYRQRYAGIFAYLDRMKKEAIANGFVTTILGRRRYFNFINDNLRRLRGANPEDIDLTRLKLSNYDAQLLRAAANAPIQGSSADIIKIAMVKLHQILPNYRSRLLLQVHDELVFEIPPDEWQELQPQIKFTMESAVQLSIPLLVDVCEGQNWMEAK